MEDIICLFWKESLRVSNLIKEHHVDLDGILEINAKLRFLMPVRNPLDCAVSNLRTRYSARFRDFEALTLESTIESILKEFAWFFDWHERHPHRFFYYFQDDFSEDVIRDLAAFLGIEADERWIEDCLHCYDMKSSYDHPAGVVEHYRGAVDEYLADHPVVRQRLHEFAH